MISKLAAIWLYINLLTLVGSIHNDILKYLNILKFDLIVVVSATVFFLAITTYNAKHTLNIPYRECWVRVSTYFWFHNENIDMAMCILFNSATSFMFKESTLLYIILPFIYSCCIFYKIIKAAYLAQDATIKYNKGV